MQYCTDKVDAHSLVTMGASAMNAAEAAPLLLVASSTQFTHTFLTPARSWHSTSAFDTETNASESDCTTMIGHVILAVDDLRGKYKLQLMYWLNRHIR